MEPAAEPGAATLGAHEERKRKRAQLRRVAKIMEEKRNRYDQILLGYQKGTGLVYVEVKGHDDPKSSVMWKEGERLPRKFRIHLIKQMFRIIFGKGSIG